MSTTTQTVQDFVLDDAARRLLTENIHFDMTGDDVSHAENTDEFETHLRDGLKLVRLLRAVENALLPADQVPAAVSLVRKVREEALDRIKYEQASHAKYLAGDEGHAYYGLTPQENRDEHARQVQEAVGEVAACDAFLAEASA